LIFLILVSLNKIKSTSYLSRESIEKGGFFCQSYLSDDGTLLSNSSRPKHFADHVVNAPIPVPEGVEVEKVMIEEYLDDFKSLTRVHHSVGGVYITDCFLPYTLRSQLVNILILGFIPRGVPFQVFYQKLMSQIIQLEKGILVDLDGKTTLLQGGIGVSTADLPQGNDKVEMLRHNAKQGCRSCDLSSSELWQFPETKNRIHEDILATRKKIKAKRTKQDKDALTTETGVKEESSVFEVISIDIGLDLFLL